MPFLPEPKKRTGFETSDGKIHENILEARKHENELDFAQYVKSHNLPRTEEELLEWINEHSDRIKEYLYRKSGSGPYFMNEG